jgi:hypothetical protein
MPVNAPNERHKDYATVMRLIESQKLRDFLEIFEIIPRSVINKDLGINYTRYNNLLKEVQGFKLKELYKLSRLLNVEEKVILDLAHDYYMTKKKVKSLRKK